MDEMAVVEKLPTPMRAVRVIKGVIDATFEAEKDVVAVAIGVAVVKNVDTDDGRSKLCADEIVGTIETAEETVATASAVDAAEST